MSHAAASSSSTLLIDADLSGQLWRFARRAQKCIYCIWNYCMCVACCMSRGCDRPMSLETDLAGELPAVTVAISVCRTLKFVEEHIMCYSCLRYAFLFSLYVSNAQCDRRTFVRLLSVLLLQMQRVQSVSQLSIRLYILMWVGAFVYDIYISKECCCCFVTLLHILNFADELSAVMSSHFFFHQFLSFTFLITFTFTG